MVSSLPSGITTRGPCALEDAPGLVQPVTMDSPSATPAMAARRDLWICDSRLENGFIGGYQLLCFRRTYRRTRQDGTVVAN